MRGPAILVVVLLPVLGHAAQLEVLTLPNWQRVPVGEDALLDGGAVVARTSGPAAGFNNPAGLAGLEKPTVSGSLSLVEYNRTASRTAGGSATTDSAQIRPNLVGFAEAWDETEPDGAGWAFTLSAPIDWASALEVRSNSGGGTRRDTGRSSLTVLVPGLSAGWSPGGTVQLGVALEAWIAEYTFDSGTSVSDATTALTSSYSESGRQVSLRFAAGAQWSAGAWRLGIMARSPGWRISDSGEVSASTTSGDASGTSITSVNDTDAGFTMPLPFSATVGLAWNPAFAERRFKIEGDLAFVAGGPGTTVLGSADGTTTTITSGGTTSAPYHLAERSLDPHWVLNPRLGMSYQLADPIMGRTVRLHLGGYIERSPVTSSDLFTRINLLGATGGVSLEHGPLRASFGAVYVTNATLSQTLDYVTSPQSGFQPSLENTNATFAVRSFILAIGSTYRFGT